MKISQYPRYIFFSVIIPLAMFWASPATVAQTVMSVTPMTTCTTTLVDPGGATGNYGNNLDITQIFTPTSAVSKLRVSFQSFATEQNFDKLYIYDGGNTSANLLGIFSGTTSPGTLTASNAQGQLTFRFVTDAQNTAAGWSATLSCITLPIPPSNLALSVISQTQINLSWQDNSNNETGFKIERSANDQTNYTQITTVGAGITTYQDNSLSANTTYFYRIRAYNGDGNADFADPQTQTTLPNAPTAPSNLSATPISSTQINLAWQDNANNETEFKLERSKGDNTGFAEVATVNKNTTAYEDQNLEPATTYFYRIRAINTGGTSGYSPELQTQTQLPPPPQAPASLTAQATSNTKVQLTWQDNATTETGFTIERSQGDANNFVEVTTVGVNVTAYTDQNLTEITDYFYRVKAINAGGGSAYTAIVSAKTQLGIPIAPSGLSVVALSQTQIKLSWQDNSATETGYKIERKTQGETSFSEIVSNLSAGTTTYADMGLTAQTTYVYRIRAFNTTGNSAYTTEASTTTWINVPQTPTNFTATPISQSEIKLDWQDVATTETGYLLEVSVGNTGTYEQLATLAANATTYADQNRIPETLYHYRLVAQNSGGNSIAAEILATIPRLPEAPDSLYLEAISPTEVRLRWKDVSVNEGEFIIERKSIGVDFTQIGVATANEQTFVDATVSPRTLYEYRVKARHSAGESFYSNTARIDLAVGLSAAAQQLRATIQLYPNPGKDKLQLGLENNYRGPVKISVRSLQGALIYQQNYDKQQAQWQTTLDLSQVPQGVYLIEVSTKEANIGKKWIKR